MDTCRDSRGIGCVGVWVGVGEGEAYLKVCMRMYQDV